MNKIGYVSSVAHPTKQWFTSVPNRFVLVAAAALFLLAAAFIALRNGVFNQFSAPTSRSIVKPTPVVAETKADRLDRQSRALLVGLKPYATLKDQALQILQAAREFSQFVIQSANPSERAPYCSMPPTAEEIVPKQELGENSWTDVTLLRSGRSLYVLPTYPYDYNELKINTHQGQLGQHTVEFADCIGNRDEMQDAYTYGDRSHPLIGNFSYAGVFDGHGDVTFAAEFVATCIADFLLAEFEEISRQSLNLNEDEKIAACILALNNALIKLDEAYLRHKVTVFGKERAPTDGTTAVVALIVGGRAIVANLGDSRALLVQAAGNTVRLSDDAECTKKRFIDQVEALGGSIHAKRVFGQIAVPVAVGDHNVKRKEDVRKCMGNIPEITLYEDIKEGDELVLVCDGITDALSDVQIAEILKNDQQDIVPNDVSKTTLLARTAMKTIGQNDNVTVGVIRFGSIGSSTGTGTSASSS